MTHPIDTVHVSIGILSSYCEVKYVSVPLSTAPRNYEPRCAHNNNYNIHIDVVVIKKVYRTSNKNHFLKNGKECRDVIV